MTIMRNPHGMVVNIRIVGIARGWFNVELTRQDGTTVCNDLPYDHPLYRNLVRTADTAMRVRPKTFKHPRSPRHLAKAVDATTKMAAAVWGRHRKTDNSTLLRASGAAPRHAQ